MFATAACALLFPASFVFAPAAFTSRYRRRSTCTGRCVVAFSRLSNCATAVIPLDGGDSRSIEVGTVFADGQRKIFWPVTVSVPCHGASSAMAELRNAGLDASLIARWLHNSVR